MTSLNYRTEYYKQKYIEGKAFEQFVKDTLAKENINLDIYEEFKLQIEKGESQQGFEIKLDNRFLETGNLYIEYKEKSKAENINYVESGILRKDNTWLWIIGNTKRFYIIDKNFLIRVYKMFIENYKQNKFGIEKRQTPTSMGMLIPIDFLEKYKYYAKKVECNEDNN